MNFFGTILAEEAAEQNPYQTLIFLAIAAAFFYLILWRPEQKRRKKMNQLRETLKAGDKVTAMGIVATVEAVNEATVVVKNVDGSKLEMIKAAITEIHPTEQPKVEQPQSEEPKA